VGGKLFGRIGKEFDYDFLMAALLFNGSMSFGPTGQAAGRHWAPVFKPICFFPMIVVAAIGCDGLKD